MKKLIVKAIPKTKKQLLQEQGREYYNFVFPIEVFSTWCNLSNTEKPNDRLLELIKKDIQAHHE